MSKVSTDKALIIAEDIQKNVGEMFQNPSSEAALALQHDAQKLLANPGLRQEVQNSLKLMELGNLPGIEIDQSGQISSVVQDVEGANVYRLLVATPTEVVLDKVHIQKPDSLDIPSSKI